MHMFGNYKRETNERETPGACCWCACSIAHLFHQAKCLELKGKPSRCCNCMQTLLNPAGYIYSGSHRFGLKRTEPPPVVLRRTLGGFSGNSSGKPMSNMYRPDSYLSQPRIIFLTLLNNDHGVPGGPATAARIRSILVWSVFTNIELPHVHGKEAPRHVTSCSIPV